MLAEARAVEAARVAAPEQRAAPPAVVLDRLADSDAGSPSVADPKDVPDLPSQSPAAAHRNLVATQVEPPGGTVADSAAFPPALELPESPGAPLVNRSTQPCGSLDFEPPAVQPRLHAHPH